MRTAELIAAVSLMGLSLIFMVMATALPIGWDEYSGPGGGAFPFWLGFIMLITSALILAREWRAFAANRYRDRPYFSKATWQKVVIVIGALFITIGLMPLAGTYVAVPLFLLFYLRMLGHHGWKVTAPIVILTPFILFFFFEVTLKILLPKGYTEPLFIPLYAIFF